ncbi:MAG TPA: DUF3606 domain-containing protein [Chitinophagaceae bacterium]|nr:DUF3606 domain-containing protein [Chitinophagaceae bacterium]
MSDNIRKRGVQDRMRINIHDTTELNEWAKQFGVNPATVLEAVNSAGPVVNNVREWLHNRGYIKAS